MRIYKKRIYTTSCSDNGRKPTLYRLLPSQTHETVYIHILFMLCTHITVQRPYSPVVFFLSDIVSSHQTPPYTEFSAPVPAGTDTMYVCACVYIYYICTHTIGHIPSTVTKSAAHVLRLKVRNPFYIGNIPRNVSQQTTRAYTYIRVRAP